MAEAIEAPKPSPVAVDLDAIAHQLKPLGSLTRLRLLKFLTQPHYLEEVANHLKLNRFAAKRHVDELVAIGLVRAIAGRRDSGPVRDYVVAPESFFALYDAVRALGEIRPAPDAFSESMPGALTRTKTAGPPRARDRARSAFPYLAVCYGAEIGRVFALMPRRDGPSHWTIGRDPKSDVLLDTDPYVSNRHARILCHGPDYVLADTYATNGSWLNWARVPEGGEIQLHSGDVVGIGKTLLAFRRETA